MKKLIILLMLICGTAYAQDSYIYRPTPAPIGITPGQSGVATKALVDNYARVQVVVNDTASGLSQSVVPTSNSLNAGLGRISVDVPTGTDAVEAASTTTVLNLTSHALRVGDAIKLTSGTAANIGAQAFVKSVTTNTVTLSSALPATPAAADALTYYRPTPFEMAYEDVARVSGFPSFPMMGTRQDGFADRADADGDYTQVSINRYGVQYADIQAGGQLSNATGILKLEDAAAASGDALVAIGGVVTTVLGTPAAVGDYAAPIVGTHGQLVGTLVNDTNISNDRQPVRAEDDGFTSGQVLMMSGAVNNRNWGTYNSTNGDATPISVGDRGAVTSMLMYDSSLGGGSSPIILEDDAFGSTGAMVMAGFQMETALTANAGTTGDASQAKVDAVGRLITTMAPAGETWAGCSAAATGTSNTQIKAAVPSNRIYVTSISCTNTAAAVDSEINFKDGTGYFYTGYVNGTTKGASNWQTTFPIPLRGSVNTSLNFSMTTTATNTICCASGYISVN